MQTKGFRHAIESSQAFKEKKSHSFFERSIDKVQTSMCSRRLDNEQILKIVDFCLNKQDLLRDLLFLLEEIPRLGKTYDWNLGSILKHLESSTLISAITVFEYPKTLYNSVGLCWALGEQNSKDERIITFLNNVINEATNPEAWWRAAFSLEQLGSDKAVNILKRSLKYNQLGELKDYLSSIEDKRSVIGVLVKSNAQNLPSIIYPKLKDIFIHSVNKDEVLNSCWLLGRLNLIDRKIIQKLIELSEDDDIEVKYNVILAIQNNPRQEFKSILMGYASGDQDPTIRKQAVKSLVRFNESSLIPYFEALLDEETSEEVIAEISRGIYQLKNPFLLKKVQFC